MTLSQSTTSLWHRKILGLFSDEQTQASSLDQDQSFTQLKTVQYTFIDLSTNTDYQKYLELEYVDYKRRALTDAQSYSDYLMMKY